MKRNSLRIILLFLTVIALGGCRARQISVSENNEGYSNVDIPEITNTPMPEKEYGISKNEVVKGDSIYFGSYTQENSTVRYSMIEWIVLEVEEDRALLLSKQGLDIQQYNSNREAVTWETCTLRSWLNSDFYDSAFGYDEMQAILETTLTNEDNPEHGTDSGNDTQDKVFLLSKSEADKYLTEETRASIPTTFVRAHFFGWEEKDDADEPMRYWLRTAGDYEHHVMTMGVFTNVFPPYERTYDYEHRYEVNDLAAVRPAIWVKLAE